MVRGSTSKFDMDLTDGLQGIGVLASGIKRDVTGACEYMYSVASLN